MSERFQLAVEYEPRTGGAGERLGRGTGASLELQDRRAYQVGDDVRHLDWRAFARTDQLLVRQYREEILPRVEILVDASRSMALDDAKAARTVDLAWILTAAAQKASFDAAFTVLGARAERTSVEELSTAGFELESERPLMDVLREAVRFLRPGSLRILVSDFLSPHDPTTLVQLLGGRAGGLLLLQLLAPEDADPPSDAAWKLTDAETGAELDLVVDAAARKRYLERLQRLCTGLETECLRLGASFVSLRTDVELARTCRDDLARRGVLAPI